MRQIFLILCLGLTALQAIGQTSSATRQYAIAAGTNHTCAMTPSGGLRCWGDNQNRQLGDGSMTTRDLPYDVVGLTTGIAAVATGSSHSCAVTESGGAWCWGSDGLSGPAIATQVPGLSSGIAAVTAGDMYTCALTTTGGVKCWGFNSYGQLGVGVANQASLPPSDVVGLTSGVAAIAAGYEHACALTLSGAVKCWGRNASGQLGDGSTTDRAAPVEVQGLSSGVVAIAAGRAHSCAVTAAGGVACWGANGNGQLGTGGLSDQPTAAPTAVIGLPGTVLSVAAGDAHTCAITAAGGLVCWGSDYSGQLGDGPAMDQIGPVQVAGLAGGVAQIVSGGSHSCALMSAGGIKCWGYNGWGQLGDGTQTDRPAPVDVLGLSTERYILSVAWSGPGRGQITSEPSGVVCNPLPWHASPPEVCYAAFAVGETVQLTAYPWWDGSTMGRWSGDCSGSSTTCTITMTAARQVGVSFGSPNPPLYVSLEGNGAGTVYSSPSGIYCRDLCNSNYAASTVVTLYATPSPGSHFDGWSGGGCSGSSPSCSVSMVGAQYVTARFTMDLPLPSCTVRATATAVMPGGATTLIASCTPAVTRYNWGGLGGCFLETGASCTVTPSADTQYWVQGRNAAGVSSAATISITLATDAATTFPGIRADYRVTASGGSYTVTGTATGREGTTTVSSGDHLRFADMSVNLVVQAKVASLPAAVAQRLQELYVAFFNRVPDADGLAYWIDQYRSGRSLNEIADNFYAVAVSQFSSQTGYSSTMGNSAFISRIYLNVLGRSSPDAAGLAYWLASLGDGSQTRGSLVNTIIEAAHTYKTDADPNLRAVADLLDNKLAVATRFAVTLGLSYNNVDDSISHGMAIAAAVTAGSIDAAISLIGITDPVSSSSGNVQRYTLNAAAGVAAPTPAFPALAAQSARPSGLWGDPEETGWGLSIFEGSEARSMLLYSYDADGIPVWYALPQCVGASNACAGQIIRPAGQAQAATAAGYAALQFADEASAILFFDLDGRRGIKSISRHLASLGRFDGHWMSGDDPLWGASVIQQGDGLFVLLHGADAARKATWHVAPNCRIDSAGNRCTAELYQLAGGAPLGTAWLQAARINAVGTVSLQFNETGSAQVTYVINGVSGAKGVFRTP